MVAETLGATLEYHWLPDRRGYLRKTLDAHECDLVLGLLAGSERTLTTKAYYRSTYVLAYRADRIGEINSLDDPRLRTLAIGVALVGNDLAATPPAHGLAQRGITGNVVGFPMFGEGTATQRMMAGLADGTLDVAVMWGAQAGYFAKQSPKHITILPLHPNVAHDDDPFEFEIAMGVRRDDAELARDVDAALVSLRPRIERLLDEFSVVRTVSP
jgi:mxaJ protein